MEQFLKKFRLGNSTAVLLRYSVAIVGAILTTAGFITQTDLDKVVDAVTQITSGVSLVVSGGMMVIPVVFALWKAWFKPAMPLNEMPVEVAKKAIVEVKEHREAVKEVKQSRDNLFKRIFGR